MLRILDACALVTAVYGGVNPDTQIISDPSYLPVGASACEPLDCSEIAVAGPQGFGSPDPADSAIEAEIAEVITEFNEVLTDGAIDEILEYFVADQAEALKPIVETAFATKDVIQQLRGELGTKLPDATDRIENAVNTILVDMSLELKGETLNVKSDTEVGVSVKGGVISQEYSFVIEDEEWYIRVAESQELAERGTALERGLHYYRDMLESVRSGAVPAEDRLKELESAVAAAQTTAPADTETESNAGDAPSVDDDAGD